MNSDMKIEIRNRYLYRS